MTCNERGETLIAVRNNVRKDKGKTKYQKKYIVVEKFEGVEVVLSFIQQCVQKIFPFITSMLRG